MNAIVAIADPFAAYGQSAARGQYLSFSKGDWIYGQEKTELPLGTRLAANMAMFRRGWKRWENKEVTGENMTLLIDMVPIPSRSSLGDNDPEMWVDRDDSGEARDPWQLVNEVPLMDNEGNVYTFSIGSKGGINCMARLCGEYAKQRRMRGDQVPIVQLGKTIYEHKKWGRTTNPSLEIVGWTDWVGEEMLALGDGSSGNLEAVEDDEIPFDDSKAISLISGGGPVDTLAANASGPAKADKVNVAKSGYDQVLNERQAKAEELRLAGIAKAKANADAALAAVAAGKGSEAAAVAAVEKTKRATRF